MSNRRNGKRNNTSKYHEVVWELVERFRKGDMLSKETIQKEYFPSKSIEKWLKDKGKTQYCMSRAAEILLEDYGLILAAVEGGRNPRHGVPKIAGHAAYVINQKYNQVKSRSLKGQIAQKSFVEHKVLEAPKIKRHQISSPRYTNGGDKK